MSLATNEFIRRFLIHDLPKGFRRIRHYANGSRVETIARARELLGAAAANPRPMLGACTGRSDGFSPLRMRST